MWADKGRSAGRVPRALDADLPPRGADGRDREPPRRPDRGQVRRRGARRLGSDAKFPLPRTIEFALKRDRGRALRTLDAVRDHLADDVAGGFFRFAGTPDWGDVAYEKPIDTNAAVTRAFANAYLYTGDEAYLARARDRRGRLSHRRPLDRLRRWRERRPGGSDAPTTPASAADREELDPPRRDLTVFAGGNALAADALLAAVAAYTDDERAREYAERILDGLERDLIDADSGQ